MSRQQSLMAAIAALSVFAGGFLTAALQASHTQPHRPSECVSQQGLPDLHCTPGAINPNVTQANIHQTICVTGWTATLRPPVSYTNPLKLQQIKAYGYSDTNPSHYEEDHLISLELGGAPSDPKNLWPEPGASPNDKDMVESRLRQWVCSGRISLDEAQRRIANNWHTALNP